MKMEEISILCEECVFSKPNQNSGLLSKRKRLPFTREQSEAIQSLRIYRIILPVILGIAVVFYLFWRQFDPVEFAQISWESHTLIWLFVAVIFLVIRHLAYAARLRLLSQGAFSWKKSIELIFIWEFSSAVSPTSVGGSAVALFVLSQEDLPTSKTTTIVIYTIVLDTIFFILTIPLLLLLFGASIIRPGLQSLTMLDGWGLTFFAAFLFMALYGLFFFYGLFIQPRQLKALLLSISRIKLLKKYREKIANLGNGFVEASKEIKKREWQFHLKAFLTTLVAWSFRFLVIIAVIAAIIKQLPMTLADLGRLYARLETMFVILAFSPTPGGAGFHEVVFGGFLKDYVPAGIAVVVASIWRLLTYYSYLLAGAIVIPQWFRRILKKRKQRKRIDQAPEFS